MRASAAPGLVAAAIFTFTLSWNEFLYALIFINTAAYRTLPIGLAGLIRGDIVFAVLQNGSPVSFWPARTAQDRFVATLAGAWSRNRRFPGSRGTMEP